MANLQNPPRSDTANNRTLLWTALIIFALVLIGYMAYSIYRGDTTTGTYGTNGTRGTGATTTSPTTP